MEKNLPRRVRASVFSSRSFPRTSWLFVSMIFSVVFLFSVHGSMLCSLRNHPRLPWVYLALFSFQFLQVGASMGD